MGVSNLRAVIHLFRRRLPALVASLALLGASARPLLACEMAQGGGTTADAPAAAEHAGAPMAGHEHHAAHAPHAASGTESSSAGHRPVPVPPRGCDHAVGCAVMAGVEAATVETTVAHGTGAVTGYQASRVDAPPLTLDPPPPKA